MYKDESIHIGKINRNDPALKDKIKKIAILKSTTVSDIVVALIEDYVKLVEEQEPELRAKLNPVKEDMEVRARFIEESDFI